MWWGPVIAQQFLWHHSCTIYLLNIQQAAVSEWVSEWAGEWVSERVSGWDFLRRMKRRIYVISVSLYIFCMTDNGQVPTHAAIGKTVEADTSVTSFLSPGQVWLHKTALVSPIQRADVMGFDKERCLSSYGSTNTQVHLESTFPRRCCLRVIYLWWIMCKPADNPYNWDACHLKGVDNVRKWLTSKMDICQLSFYLKKIAQCTAVTFPALQQINRPTTHCSVFNKTASES